jgi:hypothetical protein
LYQKIITMAPINLVIIGAATAEEFKWDDRHWNLMSRDTRVALRDYVYGGMACFTYAIGGAMVV